MVPPRVNLWAGAIQELEHMIKEFMEKMGAIFNSL
jgi:hypothetical protein